MDALDNPQAADVTPSGEAVAAGQLALLGGAAARKHRTLWRDAFNRLIQNRLALAGGVVVLLIAFMAIFAPIIAPYSYNQPDFTAIDQFPGYPGHLLGTDEIGRDFLSRLIYGAQVSMLVGLGAQLIVFVIGVPIGAIAGYAAGKVDTILMRFVDVMYAFPQLLFVILDHGLAWTGLDQHLHRHRHHRMGDACPAHPG